MKITLFLLVAPTGNTRRVNLSFLSAYTRVLDFNKFKAGWGFAPTVFVCIFVAVCYEGTYECNGPYKASLVKVEGLYLRSFDFVLSHFAQDDGKNHAPTQQ